MTPYFDYVITSQQVTRSKPDPQMYLEALHNVNLKAEECVILRIQKMVYKLQKCRY